MERFLYFTFEHTIVNTAAIVFSILFFSRLFIRPFINNFSIAVILRVSVYSLPGVVAGLWSYSAFTIPDRSFQITELIALAVSMFVYGCVLIFPFIYYSILKQKTYEDPSTES